MANKANELSALQQEMAAMKEQIAGLGSGADGMKEMVDKQMRDLREEVGNISKVASGF